MVVGWGGGWCFSGSATPHSPFLVDGHLRSGDTSYVSLLLISTIYRQCKQRAGYDAGDGSEGSEYGF